MSDLIAHYECNNFSSSSEYICEYLRGLKIGHIDGDFLLSNFTLDTVASLLGDYPPLKTSKFRFLLLRVAAYTEFLRREHNLGNQLEVLLRALEMLAVYLKNLSEDKIGLQSERASIDSLVSKNFRARIDEALSLQPYEPSPGYRWVFLPAELKTQLLCWRFVDLLNKEADQRVTRALRTKNIFGEVQSLTILNGLQYTNLVQELSQFPPFDTFDRDLKRALS